MPENAEGEPEYFTPEESQLLSVHKIKFAHDLFQMYIADLERRGLFGHFQANGGESFAAFMATKSVLCWVLSHDIGGMPFRHFCYQILDDLLDSGAVLCDHEGTVADALDLLGQRPSEFDFDNMEHENGTSFPDEENPDDGG